MSLATLSNTPRPRAVGFHARLGTLLLRLAASPGNEDTIESAPLQAPPIKTGQSPEEFGLQFGSLYARSEFTGGEGLDFAHQRESSPRDARRFWASKGVDVFPDDPDLLTGPTLLHSTSNVEAATDTNLHVAHDGTAFYMAEGTDVRRSTDMSTFTTEDPNAGEAVQTVEDLTAFGEDLYAALGTNGIHTRDGGTGTWSAWSDLSPATGVWALKTFIVAASDNALYEAAAAAGSTLLLTVGPNRTFTAAADAGAAILVASDDGWIYAVGDDGAGGLELKGQTFVGEEEVPYAIGARGDGLVIFATRQANNAGGAIGRVYLATLDTSSFTLTVERRLRTWGDLSSSTDHAPRKVFVSRDSAWVGVNDGTTGQLWRYHLGFDGIARDVETASTAGTVVDIGMFDGRLAFTVSGAGLFWEDTTYVSEGWIMGPLGDLFTAETKPWVGALLDHVAIPSDATVDLYRTTDPGALSSDTDSSWVRVKNITSGTDTTETRMSNVEGRFLAGMVKLTPTSDAASSPQFRAFSFRAYPPQPDQIIDLVVNLSDVLSRRGKRPVRAKRHGRELYDNLKGKEGKYQELELFSTDEIFQGTVESVRQPTVDEARLWPYSVAFLRFRGRRALMGGVSTSDSGLGISTLGVGLMGT